MLRIFLLSALLLSIERISYVWICRYPERFGRVAAQLGTDAIGLLRALFYAFKLVQIAVFLSWCYAAGDGRIWPATVSVVALGVAAPLIVGGQILNAGVFYCLGPTGVFYGTKFGHSLPRSQAFPFSLLAHPQYVGTTMSIWGFFLIMRFPNPDWPVIPLLETLYYFLGSRYEH